MPPDYSSQRSASSLKRRFKWSKEMEHTIIDWMGEKDSITGEFSNLNQFLNGSKVQACDALYRGRFANRDDLDSKKVHIKTIALYQAYKKTKSWSEQTGQGVQETDGPLVFHGMV